MLAWALSARGRYWPNPVTASPQLHSRLSILTRVIRWDIRSRPHHRPRDGKETTMKTYLLAIYPSDAGGEAPPRDVLDKIMQDVRAIREDMKAAGVWVFSGGLDSPRTSTVLRLRGADVLKTDGPFIESKEYIGGVTIVHVANQDEALNWARKLVDATGLSIEVRPFLLES